MVRVRYGQLTNTNTQTLQWQSFVRWQWATQKAACCWYEVGDLTGAWRMRPHSRTGCAEFGGVPFRTGAGRGPGVANLVRAHLQVLKPGVWDGERPTMLFGCSRSPFWLHRCRVCDLCGVRRRHRLGGRGGKYLASLDWTLSLFRSWSYRWRSAMPSARPSGDKMAISEMQ